jgi:tetratricopeptide (TPR) repeat protein
LDAELGLEPGPDLTRLQQAILRREPIVDERPAAVIVPRQLPSDISNLVGRDVELAALRKSDATVRAVHGPGGVGKSALIVRLAHELAPDFPDGQLYVDLQGSNPRLTPLTPAEVLGRFIRALSPSFQDVPTETAEAASLFRSLVAGRRIMLILDNAIDAAQIRSLLPGTPPCVVLVTSRRALTVIDDAEHLSLRVLAEGDALALFAGEADLAATRQLVELCGRLPLALRIAAARLAARPDWSAADLLARLRDHRQPLDELQVGDLGLRSCFEASYHALDAPTARAFRLAGHLRVPHVSAEALAAALGESHARARAVADALIEANLFEPDGAGYRLHDLLGAFAAERAVLEETPDELSAAMHRVLVYFLSAIRHAMKMLYGFVAPIHHQFAEAESADVTWLSSISASDAWLDREWPNAVGVAERADGSHDAALYLGQLLRSTMHFWIRRLRFDDVRRLAELVLAHASIVDEATHAVALVACGEVEKRTGDTESARLHYAEAINIRERLDDHRGLAAAWNGLALVERYEGNLEAAISGFMTSREIMHRSGDLSMEPFLMVNIVDVLEEQGRFDEAFTSLRRALRSVRSPIPAPYKIAAFPTLARLSWRRGEVRRAMRYFERSLELSAATGEVQATTDILLCRAAAYLRMSKVELAIADAERVRAAATENGDSYRHAASLRILGQSHAAMNELDRARHRWRQAELLFRRLDRPYERQVEAFLLGGDLTLPRPTE